MNGGFVFIFVLFVVVAIAAAIYITLAASKRREDTGQPGSTVGIEFLVCATSMIAAIHSNSETVFTVLIVGAFVVAGIVGSINQMRARRNRSFELQLLTTQLGFDDFNPARDEEFAMGWGFLNRLARGEDRYAFNLLRGIYHEQRLFVFDYHYQTGSGKNRKDHYSTIFMLVCKEAFPQVTIKPENLLSRLAAAFDGEDIKFESAEFSKTFRVRSADKKFAYDVCNPQMMEYLLANRDLEVEIQGPAILLAFEPQLPVGQIEFNLQRLIEIRSRLPEYLFTQNT